MLRDELRPYLATEPMTPLVKAYLAKIDRKERRTIDFLVMVNQMVSRTSSTSSAWSPACRRRKKR